MRARRIIAALAVAGFAACGHALPSETPLGGLAKSELPTEEEAAERAQRRDAASDADATLAAKPAPSATPPAVPEASVAEASAIDAAVPKPAAEAGAVAMAGPVCDDSKGSPGDCRGIEAPGGEPCFMVEPMRQACDQLSRLMKPKSAEKLVSCFLSKSRTRSVCDPSAGIDCVQQAARASCPDPTTEPVCKEILGKCKPDEMMAALFTSEMCNGGLAALRQSSREKLIACMKQRCDLPGCASEL